MFKVGDKVVRTNEDFEQFKVGDIATVVKLDNFENIYVTNDIIVNCWNVSPKCPGAYGVLPKFLRLATPLEQLL